MSGIIPKIKQFIQLPSDDGFSTNMYMKMAMKITKDDILDFKYFENTVQLDKSCGFASVLRPGQLHELIDCKMGFSRSFLLCWCFWF